MGRTALWQFLTLAFAATTFAHNSVVNFIPAVPDPLAMVADGLDDDWGWYDRETFALTEWIAKTYGRDRVVSDTDMTMIYLAAWSPPPDNGYYVFARVTDDTLRIGEADNDVVWWNDDNLKQGFDMDHGGGNWVENEEEGYSLEEATAAGYHFSFNPVYSNVVGLRSSPSENKLPDPAFYNWQVDPPFARWRSTVSPANPENFTPNVEITFEYHLRTFDELNMNDFPSSIQHVWEEAQVVHINVAYEDGDWGAHGRDQIWHQPGAIFQTNNFEGNGTDTVALLNDMHYEPDTYPNSFDQTLLEPVAVVEHTTWARIKSRFNQ